MSEAGYIFQESRLTPPAAAAPVADPILNHEVIFEKEMNGHAGEKRDSEDQDEAIALYPHTDSPPDTKNTVRFDPTPTFYETTELLRQEFSPDSHELAHRDTGLTGAVLTHYDEELPETTRDIGWHKANLEIPDPLIGDLPNSKLFSMIRRFNKVRTAQLS